MPRFFPGSGLAITVLAWVTLGLPTTTQAVQKEKGKEKVDEIGAAGLTIENKLANTDNRDPSLKNCYCKMYLVKMAAGKTYVIRMNAKSQQEIDAVLRVEDATGKELAFNDDAPGENTLNSRIDFKCPQDGVYRVYCTSLRPNQVGDFTLFIKLTK